MSEIKELQSFLDASVSVYHAVAFLEELLQQKGYTRLLESAPWDLVPGGKYYMTRSGSSLIAFRIPDSQPTGFMMSAAHCDRPTFKLKVSGELVDRYVRQSVEPYGGMIMYSWMDRPLSVAGRVLVKTAQGVEQRLINIDRDLLMIPSVAIHMNRKVNEGTHWNPAVDLLPLTGGKDVAGKLEEILTEAAGGEILGRDLYLYVRQKSSVWGMNEEFISGQALDDLQCVWGCTQGFLNAKPSRAIPVLSVFDSEEVGSSSQQGAGSDILERVLTRICQERGLNMQRMLAQSFQISADNGHAVHPNHPEYADPTNAPVINGGLVIKYNANLRYCTDGLAAAVFRSVCLRSGVKAQNFFNRADVPGGSTLGRISLAHVSVPTVDVGLPQLAMHSSYETAGVRDSLDMVKVMTTYYSCTLVENNAGYDLI